MTEIIGLRAAAELIGILPATLAHWLDVGDVLPERGLVTGSQHDGTKWPDYKLMAFTSADIERYKLEKHRRSFADFKREFADVYRPDDGPNARGLKFGPGWMGILQEFSEMLRDFNDAGAECRLRGGKEKFGALKLFVDDGDEIQRYVSHATGIAYGRSLGTCQECGAPGRLRFGAMICLTACERHAHIVSPLDESRDGIILDVDAWSRSQRRLPE